MSEMYLLHNVKEIKLPLVRDANYINIIRMTQNNMLEGKKEDVIQGFFYLRTLLKFHKELFIVVFDNLYDKFKKFMFNENDEIVANAFVLLYELFNEDFLVPEIKDWLSYLIPEMLKASAMENSNFNPQVKSLIDSILNLISKKAFHEVTLMTFLGAMNDNNEIISLNASKSLHTFFMTCDKTFLIEFFNWDEIFENVITMFMNVKKKNLAEGLVKSLSFKVLNEDEFCTVLAKVESHILTSVNVISPFDKSKVFKKRKQLNRSEDVI